jgi:hypothetical protein
LQQLKEDDNVKGGHSATEEDGKQSAFPITINGAWMMKSTGVGIPLTKMRAHRLEERKRATSL